MKNLTLKNWNYAKKVPVPDAAFKCLACGFMYFDEPGQTSCPECKSIKVSWEYYALWRKVVPFRCNITGNIVGTDTWAVGHPCKCLNCRELNG